MDLMVGDKSVQDACGQGPSSSDRWRGAVGVRIGAELQCEQATFQTALLSRAIEEQVIPRLIRAHPESGGGFCPPLTNTHQISPLQLREFSKMAIASDFGAAQKRVRTLQAGGMPVAAIYLELLAPAARDLGTLWEEDLCDIADVTIGLGRLQQLLRELSPNFHHAMGRISGGWRLLLLPSPGERHTFGLAMAAEFFRHAGWDVAGGPGLAGDLPVVMAAREWFDVIGFSLASDFHIEELRNCIGDVRKAALNPHVGIMVGGPVFATHPQYGALVGADVAVADGRLASELAAKLVVERARVCT
jgi:MerR family transcriptional regulator, light-induced transcriptional regulator